MSLKKTSVINKPAKNVNFEKLAKKVLEWIVAILLWIPFLMVIAMLFFVMLLMIVVTVIAQCVGAELKITNEKDQPIGFIRFFKYYKY